jgi:gliding motility-associated-like protein
MKKLYLRLIAALVNRNSGYKVAGMFILALTLSSISYTALAQVIITRAGGGTTICQSTAVGGTAAGCTTLNPLTITESAGPAGNADFPSGASQIILNPPAGWQFCIGTTPTATFAPGGDVTGVTVAGFTPTSVTLNISALGVTNHDAIIISNISVQALSASSVPGYIFASSVSGVVGISTGAGPGTSDFGDLALLPGVITGLSSVCVGDSVTLSSSPGPVVWSVFPAGIATVTSSSTTTAWVKGITPGTVTITATIAGCSRTLPGNFKVNSNPPSITGLLPVGGPYHMCAWYDSLTISDVASAPGVFGIFNSSLVTVDNFIGTGTAKLHANAPGTASVTYTFPTGCSTTSAIIVDPLPAPIQSPPFIVCQGSTKTLTDISTPGVWSSSTPAVGTIGSLSGVFGGVAPGTSLVIYTIPGGFGAGCITDTTMTVIALPAPIILVDGVAELCLGRTIRVADPTPGGLWSSVTTTVATIIPTILDTAVISGVGVGTSIISYTVNGCATTIVVTVDPLPGTITGPRAVCVNDSVQLLNTTPGGTWTSSTSAIATINATTGFVTGVSPGVDTITYTIMPGSCTATFLITVNPLPALITGPDSICVGSDTLLANATPGGRWFSNDSLTIAHIDAGVSPGPPPGGRVFGISAGYTSIYYVLPTGCRVSVLFTVNPLPPAISSLTDHLCIGDSTLLIDLTPSGGTWTSSAPSILAVTADYSDSARVKGLTAGIATITFTGHTGACYTTKTITVNALPSPIFSDTSVCVGQFVFLHDLLPGTWTVDAPGGFVVAVIDTFTGKITGIQSGSSLVHFTTAGGCTTSLFFNVNPLAQITGATHELCQGDSLLVANGVPGGTWGSTNTSILTIAPFGVGSSIDSNIAYSLNAGVASITYTTPEGCIADPFIVTVDPISPIVAGGSTTICANDSVDLIDATPGGTWTSSDGSIATVGSITGRVKGVGAGVAVITYTMPTGCRATILINVLQIPGPIYGRDSVCVGDTIQLRDSLTAIGTWSVTNVNASITPTDTPAVLTGRHAGLDTVIFTYGSRCAVSKVIKINPLSPIYGTDTVCVGQVLVAYDTTAGAPGTWSVLHTPIDTIVSTSFGSGVYTVIDRGVTAGLDTILYTVAATGCIARFPITVNPLPTITSVANDHHVCEGDTILLTGHTSGGHWTHFSNHVSTLEVTDSTAKIGGISTGFDTVMYTLPTGCSDTFIVTVNHTPSAIVGDTVLCLGRYELLTDPSIGGYWTSRDTSIIKLDTTGGTIYAHGVGLGRDTVTYTLPVGTCSSQIIIRVVPIPVIVATQTHPGTICRGASDTLFASGAGPLGRYTWSPSFGLISTTGPTIVASPTLTTTYTVTGTSFPGGCDSTTTITVIVDDSLNNIKVIGKENICLGECDTLMASGRAGTLFNWHAAQGLSCVICDTTIACPTVTTTYTGIAIDDLGCKDSVAFTVNVRPVPVIRVTPNPAILCRGTPLQLFATTLNTDNSTTTFAWSPNLFISNDSVFNPIINDTSSLVYRVTATTIYGCHDSFNVKVSVLDTNVNSIVADTNICIGGSAQLFVFSHSVTGNLNVPVFTWSPVRGLNNPFIFNPIATPDTTTTYSVHIKENACFDTTLSVTVFVQPYPQISITPTSEVIIAGTPVQLFASVPNTPVLYYAWSPSGTLSCDSCMNPVAIPTVTTTYTVIVSSIFHCIAEDSVTLSLQCDNSQVFVPNTFTPNGDGVNDRFYISGKGISLITLFQVYSRWGQMVYEAHDVPANNPGYGWDGTFKGLVLAPDVFVYIVHAQCALGGAVFKYQGDISLVR